MPGAGGEPGACSHLKVTGLGRNGKQQHRQTFVRLPLPFLDSLKVAYCIFERDENLLTMTVEGSCTISNLQCAFGTLVQRHRGLLFWKAIIDIRHHFL